MTRLAALMMVLAVSVGPRALAAKAEHEVLIQGMKFVPDRLQVHVGDTVVWKNEDLVPHTVTAKGKSFDSPPIESGKSWRTVIRRLGDFPYFCRFHPLMKAGLSSETIPTP